MRLRDAIKLQTGDQVRCGPNACGCDGRVYTVSRHRRGCGCVLIYHDSNPVPLAVISSENCHTPYHCMYFFNATNPFWDVADDEQARELARNLKKVD